jgi:hypothetical protein
MCINEVHGAKIPDANRLMKIKNYLYHLLNQFISFGSDIYKTPDMNILRLPLRGFPILVATLILGFSGCKKESNEEMMRDEDAEIMRLTSQDDAIADHIFGDIHDLEMGVLESIGLPDIGLNDSEMTELDSIGRCLKIIITPRDPLVFPKTVVFDYGEGCRGPDGKFRKGKVITRYSAPMRVPGATAFTTFENYQVNDVKVQGRHTSKNNSTSGNRIFTRRVEDGKLAFADGGTVSWDATHTNTQTDGMGTPGFPLDDVFEITGGARGISVREGNKVEWSRRIAEPLVKAFNCRWISKGIVHITRNDNRAILDFGNGTCDNKAVIIINGQRKEITL